MLQDIAVIFALAVFVVFVCSRLNIPALVGFLITGVLAGPHGFHLVTNVANVENLAQVGVVALLFATGIQFSFKDLMRFRTVVLVGGSIQVVSTMAAAAVILTLAGLDVPQAILAGMILAMTSTVIMQRIFEDRAEISSPHAMSAIGISILQDIASVPMMLLIPYLAISRSSGVALPTFLAMAQGALVVTAMVLSANYLVPKVLYHVSRTRNRELFLLALIVIVLAIAWSTSILGLSMALGAFIAGLIISESPYSHQALGSILPLRDVFSSLFFVSVGMLLDVSYFAAHPFLIVGLALAVILGKSVLATAAVLATKYPLRTALLAGLALGQVGEFGFVLATAGLQHGMLSDSGYQLVLGISILTMIASPLMAPLGPLISNAASGARMLKGLERPSRRGAARLAGAGKELDGHMIIVGFGVNGRDLARAADASDIPHLILEINAGTVKRGRSAGRSIFYGDATQPSILDIAKVRSARVMVVGVSDRLATSRIVKAARALSPGLHIIARTQFVADAPALYDLGADEVVPEELEASAEISTRALLKYGVARAEIDRLVAQARGEGYRMLRTASYQSEGMALLSGALPDLDVTILRVAGDSRAAGRTLADLDLGRLHGVTVVAVRRGAQVIESPNGEARLEAEDDVFILSSLEKVAAVAPLFTKA